MRRCEEPGVVAWRRCPAMIVTSPEWQLLDSYGAFDAHGIMPVAGGSEDQARCWWRWVRVIGAERARIEEERRPHAPSLSSPPD